MSQQQREYQTCVLCKTGDEKLCARSEKLLTPDLELLKWTMANTLSSGFENVCVSIVDCPDLTEYGVAAPGMCGSTKLADVGGVPYMMDPQFHHINFDLDQVMEACDFPTGDDCYVMGSAAANPVVVGKNAELMCTTILRKKRNTKYSEVLDDGSPLCANYDSDTCGCLANLFLCEGKPGPILKVEASVRTGETNFVSAVGNALRAYPGVGGDCQIGLGGVILLTDGRIKAHVMPDFAPTKLEGKMVEEWLKFYEMGPHLTMLSTVLSGDPSEGESMDLRLEHTHFFRHTPGAETPKMRQEGGHYHHDVTPKDVKYVAYFSPASEIHRIQNANEHLDKHKNIRSTL